MTTKTKKPVPFARRLKRMGACEDAIEWIGKRTLAQAWKQCERADWMLWLLEHADGWSRETLNRCLVDFMALALEAARPVASKESYWPQVESAHRLVRKAITGGRDLGAARSAAWSAAWSVESAAWSAAWSAARSAAWSAAWSAARSAAWSAARSAERSAAWSAARSAERSAAADIVRKHFPEPPKLGRARTKP